MTIKNESGVIPYDINVLVLPDVIPEKTKGDIIIPEKERKRTQFEQVRGLLIDMGVYAFFDWGDDNKKPEVGDRVLIAKFGGYTVEGKDEKEYRLLCDKDIRAGIDF